MKKLLSKTLIIFTIIFSCLLISSCSIYEPNYGNKDPDTGDKEPDAGGGDTDGDKDPDVGGGDNTEIVEMNEKIINVYLIGGQSNAVGYGKDEGNIIANSDSRFVNGFDNVLYFARQERNSGVVVSNQFQPVKIGYGHEGNSCGAEIGIASAIADNGKMNAIIKCAFGATHLYPDTLYEVSLEEGTWTSPSYIKKHNIDITTNKFVGAMYRWFEETVTEGIEMLIADGYTPVIKGMWWMQGEAEMGNLEMAYAYSELLEILIKDIRKTVSDITGSDCSDMPFVFGLPSWNPSYTGAPTYQDKVREQMTTVANNTNIVNAASVDCKGLTQHDVWHFKASGQKYLGEKFVEALQTLNEGNTSKFKESIVMNNNVDILTDKDGMQFNATIANYDSNNNYNYGMIIVPTNSLIEKNITSNYISELDKANISYTNIECKVNVTDIDSKYNRASISGDISNISYKDINTSYTAIAFIKDSNGKYLYTSSAVNNTLAKAASKIIYEKSALAPAAQKYIDGGINLLNGVNESNGYNKSSFDITVMEELKLSIGHSRRIDVVQNLIADYYVKYTSANPQIITIDKDGNVHALGIGTSTITVECGGIKKEINVSVVKETINDVVYDGEIAANEYVGQTITKSNGKTSVMVSGMVKNNGIHLSLEITHEEWSPKISRWWLNDNVEMYIDGEKYTVTFYNGIVEFSEGITHGVTKTVNQNGKLVTTIEMFINGTKDIYRLKLAMNGAKFNWLDPLWANTDQKDITIDGLKTPEPGKLPSTLTLDGELTEEEWNTVNKQNAINTTANGASVNIVGKIMNEGVLFGATINHTKAPEISTNGGTEFYHYMNIEFHFNSETNNGFLYTCLNKTNGNAFFGFCKTVQNSDGTYTSTFEIYVPFTSIGLANGTTSVDFNVAGWFENNWCWIFGYNWTASHTLTANGITRK